ncbi:MAG: hypothetical protein IT186_25315 [Acidobacteria bacterium]|nr:hypothetical protein [Acidobacteriota bacterium]MCG3194516.1 hypothetical protein [Thermoanaerobaculia bacterium]MCK6685466.1 hypothetical protein [Thermoanaerobaculia bacterium]
MRLKGPFRKIFGMSKRDHGHHVGEGGIEYEVPFVHQNHVNLCGDASAQMILMFYGKQPSIALKRNVGHDNSYRIKRNTRGIVEGSNDDDVAAVINGSGLRAWGFSPMLGPWTAETVRDALETFGPYAQSVQFSSAGHWVVVSGTDGEHVIFQDPWRGQNKRKTVGEWALVTEGRSTVGGLEEPPTVPRTLRALPMR